MPAIRTVVYPTRRGAPVPLDGAKADTVPDKVMKYVPAEVIAFYAPLYSSLSGDTARIAVLAASFLGLWLYLMMRAPPNQPPRFWFYLLALVSFAGWALGTSPVGEQMLGITDPDLPKIALPVVVFLVPAFDEFLTRKGA